MTTDAIATHSWVTEFAILRACASLRRADRDAIDNDAHRAHAHRCATPIAMPSMMTCAAPTLVVGQGAFMHNSAPANVGGRAHDDAFGVASRRTGGARRIEKTQRRIERKRRKV